MKNAAFLVDNANVIHSLDLDHSHMRIDYQVLSEEVRRVVEEKIEGPIQWVLRRFYRTFRPGIERSSGSRAFDAYLCNTGWDVDYRPSKKYRDGSWADKGTDLAIALDAQAMTLNGFVEVLVIMTHDSDFAALFERVLTHIRSFVVGWSRGMAIELPQAANVIYLEHLEKAVKVS